MRARAVGELLRRSAFVIACIGATACFEFDKAYDNYCQRGLCDGGSGGGGSVGGGAGGGTPVVFDGGPRCPGSDRPRLRCDPPLSLGSDGGVSYGWMATSDQ